MNESIVASEEILDGLMTLTSSIHQATDLEHLLDRVVRAVHDLLKGDRVLIYQFLLGGDGVVIAESVGARWQPIVGQLIYDPCFQAQSAPRYQQGYMRSIADIEASHLAPCYVEFLTRLQVKANLVAPILVKASHLPPDTAPNLWGLLIVHQCSAPRIWQALEIKGLQQAATQLAIALPQYLPRQPVLNQPELGDRGEMWRKLSEQVPGVIYQYRLYPDGHSCFPYASEAIRQIYEVTPEQVRQDATAVLERLHPDDLAAVMAGIQASSQTLQLWHQEYRVVLPQQGVRWLEGHAMPQQLPDGSVLWHGYIWDVSDRKQTEIIFQQKTSYEQMIHIIAQHVRHSLDLNYILNTTVAEVQQFLQTDRVIIYRFNPDWSGIVVTESVAPQWTSILHWQITDSYFVETQGRAYQPSTFKAISDIYTAGFAPCHIEFLERLQVQAKLIVPILQGDHLWGLLIAHHCRSPRNWQPLEIEFLTQLSMQVAIAIQQSELHQQLHQLNIELESQVQKRTEQLQRTVEIEAALKRITDKVRDSLDEHQILQTVVQEVADTLKVDCCDTSIYNLDHQTLTIQYESKGGLPTAQGWSCDFAKSSEPNLYPQLLQGEYAQFCLLTSNILRPDQPKQTILACPILDDQGALGDLWLFRASDACFDEIEIRLVQQVANQCGIALRQSRLYQAAQAQVQELERLNQLKDDFLNTVSHELRTPMTSIKMALQMLETCLHPLGVLEASSNSISYYLQVLQSECNREINLINNLLDLTHIDAGINPLNLSSIHLQFWIPHVAEPFMERIRHQHQDLKIVTPEDLPPLSSDLPYLERILTELLHNACKYTPQGESITIFTQIANSDPESSDTSDLLIQVSNSGVEIPEAERDRIFDKFYRIPNNDPWKYGGTGLGLALVKKLVEQIGGSISVASSNQLTEFTLRLPLVTP
ncbi:MAG: GAF domain-containing protein [Leptolyngbyaceae bacterium]|nr:GAF domain-containing protein [Leptolyngbyaceae bacterium]